MQQPDVLSSATTGELVCIAQSGAPNAAEAATRLLIINEKMIGAIVRSLCPMAPQDEDMLQIARIAFVEAVRRFSLNHGTTLSTFARGVVTDRLIDEVRRRSRNGEPAPLESVAEDRMPVTADVLESRLDLLLLRAALGRMPASDRELLTRLHQQDGSQTVVARELGVSQQAVQKRQHRILRDLRAAVYA